MYKYEDFREGLFTDEGQRKLIPARDKIFEILEHSGVITMDKAMNCIRGGGDSWERMAVIDRLVEMGDLTEVFGNETVKGQHRVFAKGLG